MYFLPWNVDDLLSGQLPCCLEPHLLVWQMAQALSGTIPLSSAAGDGSGFQLLVHLSCNLSMYTGQL